MSRIWAMKTFKRWDELFTSGNYIGIDQYCFDQDYNSMVYDEEDLQELLDEGDVTPFILRSFDQFCNYMKPGDTVAIGVGKMTTFNISKIALITGDYRFDPSKGGNARHIRDAIWVKSFKQPVPYQELCQVSRIELLCEEDWERVVRATQMKF